MNFNENLGFCVVV